MGEKTEIAWTDATFNPWWGCVEVSPGCTHCYARTFAKRVGHEVWGKGGERREFSDAHWNAPRKWNAAALREGQRKRVFCASMADVFEDHPIAEKYRPRLFELINETPLLDWQLLTKRPENMRRFVPPDWAFRWPFNVWAGTTIEDQQRAEQRIPHLLRVPARVRFCSYEPALGPVALPPGVFEWIPHGFEEPRSWLIHWVIIGGESGPKARPFHLEWARSVIEQCGKAGVAVFMKQLGARPVGLKLRDPKGGDWDEWPADLKCRDFPK